MSGRTTTNDTTDEVCKKTGLPFDIIKGRPVFLLFSQWSWRESNPRPHKETMRFLHAYSSLDFRATARPGPPTAALSPKASPPTRGRRRLFPISLRRLILRFGTTSLERRLVRLPCKRIKLVIYCTSIKQREHTRCCQLIFRPKRLWSLQPPSSACLHTISSCRQIQSTPFMALLPRFSVRFFGIALQR